MAFTYKGETSPSFLKVMKVTRSILPPSEVKMLTVEGASGSYFVKKRNGVGKIEVEVAIVGDSPKNLRQNVRILAGFLDAEKPEPLVFADEPDLTDFGIVDGDTDVDEIFRVGTGTITFLCPKPYSQGLKKEFNVQHKTPFTVGGTAETFPVFKLTFTAAASYVKLKNGEEFVELRDSFTTGDVVVVDTQTGKITVNGSLSPTILTLDSDFFSLKPGTNSLEITTDGTVTVSMNYNEMWK